MSQFNSKHLITSWESLILKTNPLFSHVELEVTIGVNKSITSFLSRVTLSEEFSGRISRSFLFPPAKKVNVLNSLKLWITWRFKCSIHSFYIQYFMTAILTGPWQVTIWRESLGLNRFRAISSTILDQSGQILGLGLGNWRESDLDQSGFTVEGSREFKDKRA